MTKMNAQKGFTLVELAIVMTIIGLLIGGILKGQELMLNARVTATIAQVRSYEAAATTFRDSYGSLPGDMLGASNRLPGCTATCNPDTAASTTGAGNGIIGTVTWSAGWANQSLWGSKPQNETALFWVHLLLADLISGISPAAAGATVPMQWGVTHPAAKINGGFLVGYADGLNPAPGATAGSTNPTGMMLALVNSPLDVLQSTTGGVQPLTPSKAAQIDRKMDDGKPDSGFVQAWGPAASCFVTVSSVVSYGENINKNDCGLLMRIQG